MKRKKYTRLNYMNGDRVYEGDKVKYFNRIGEVVFYSRMGAFCLYSEDDKFYVQMDYYVVKMLVKL